MRRRGKGHTPSNLVVAHWTSDVEGTAPLGVLLRHNLWIPSWCLISCKIRSIISVTCDFTTKIVHAARACTPTDEIVYSTRVFLYTGAGGQRLEDGLATEGA